MPVYLGTAPAVCPDYMIVHLTESPTEDNLGHHGTTASRAAAVRWYTAVPTSHWPKGMRVNYTDFANDNDGDPAQR
jgi:hypothetical protein